MTCLNCTHWQPKKAGALARHGFGGCAHLPAHTATAPGHVCKRHKAAPESVTQARVAWLHKIAAKAGKTAMQAPAMREKNKENRNA